MKRPKAPLPSLPPGSTLVDTHCHLDMSAYDGRLNTVIAAARQHGISRMVTIGIDTTSSGRAIELARQHEGIFATVGIHPHNAEQVTAAELDRLAVLAREPNVVGFGEIGLDYVKNYAPREAQIRAFTDQLHLAKELALPVVIHDREAHADTCRILREAGPLPRGGVLHCFSGDLRLAHAAFDLGLYISIPGVVTYANAKVLRAVVAEVDPDRLLLETDAPFLTPVPFRGKVNEPVMMLYTAQMVADVRKCSLAEIAQTTTANATRLFGFQEAAHDD
ncbi:MAG: TatD family hydrolase [Desulfobulbus sp.]|jgi:TatD DNase family protein